MKLGVPPRTLWSNDQDPALLVLQQKLDPKGQRAQFTLVTFVRLGPFVPNFCRIKSFCNLSTQICDEFVELISPIKTWTSLR